MQPVSELYVPQMSYQRTYSYMASARMVDEREEVIDIFKLNEALWMENQ
jgi:hypothetical protein